MRLEFRQQLPSRNRFQEIFQQAPKETFRFPGLLLVVARVSPDLLKKEFGQTSEELGTSRDGMIFLASTLPPWKARYAAWHEHVERLVWTDDDRHSVAIESELSLARKELGRRFGAFLRWRKSVERTGFFRTERAHALFERLRRRPAYRPQVT